MDLNELMEEFAAAAGLEEFGADADGAYRLLIDEMPVAVCPAGDGHVALFAPVGEPPPDAPAGRERLYRLLLESAHLGRGTASAFFSVDAETGEICLQRLESTAALDSENFKSTSRRCRRRTSSTNRSRRRRERTISANCRRRRRRTKSTSRSSNRRSRFA